jgi:penicillin-binding protein 1A
VAIDNDTGEVRAMIGGRDYHSQPFNLATQGRRQPGSSIKPFILAEALTRGISPASVWPSRKRPFPVAQATGATGSSSTTSRTATRARTRWPGR